MASASRIESVEVADAAGISKADQSVLNKSQDSSAFSFFIEQQMLSLQNEPVEDVEDVAVDADDTEGQSIDNTEVRSNNRRTLLIFLLFQLAFVLLSMLKQRVKVFLLCFAG